MKRIKLTIEVEIIYTGNSPTALDKILPEALDIAYGVQSDVHNLCVENAYMATNSSPTFKLEEIK